MDLSVASGMVSEEHLRRARPEYLDRLRREGQIEQLRTIAPSRRKLWPVIVAEGVLLVLTLVLLAVILLASLGN